MAKNRLQFDINAKDKTKRAFGTLKRGLKGVSKAIFNMKTGLAAVAGVAGIGLLIRNSLKSIDKLGKLSRQVFISTEDLSAFRLAADLGGTSLEAFAKGARTMAVGINDWLVKGTGIAQDAFIQLGITQDDLRATNGDLFKQFQIVADALRNMKNGTDKTAAAYKLFGGRNIELLTAIERGTAGMEEMRKEAERFGIVLDTRLVKKVEDANDSITRSKMVFKGLTEHFTIALAPAIEKVSSNLRNKFLKYLDDTNQTVESLGNTLGTVLIKKLRNFLVFLVENQNTMIQTKTTFQNIAVSLENIGRALTFTGDFKSWETAALKSSETIRAEVDALSKSFDQLFVHDPTLFDFEDKKMRAILEGYKKKEIAVKNDMKVLNEAFAFEDVKRASQLKTFEDNEKKKEEIRKNAITDIKSNLEGTLQILSGHSEKAFKMLKAHKIAEAIVNTYSAVMKAFATVPYPLNYLAAGSALAFGMAQVQQIRSQKFTARRQGGAVSENKPYMVGEAGPETFIPNSSGYIAPGVGGKNIGITFNINAVDTAGFQQLLSNERGMIVGMINSAVNQQGKSDII
jgi:hypothetical protein